MPETFRCPACSAPLEFEGKTMQKCKFCGSNVIVPSGVIRDSSAFGGVGTMDFENLASLSGKGLKIAEVQRLLQNGQKIEAIKVFRETFGTRLAEAKNAVEAIARGESIDVSGMSGLPAATPVRIAVNGRAVRRAALGVGGSFAAIFLIAGLIVLGVIFFVVFQVGGTRNDFVKPSSTATPAREIKPGSIDGGSSIATEVLRFGGKGIGAGKFKDNRTVAVAPDGRIFSADYSGGRVQGFDAAGQFQLQITADPQKSVDELLVDRKGTLFVLQGYNISRFDSANGDPRGTIRVDNASDMALALDGKLYVSTRRGDINVLGPDGAKLGTVKIGKDLNIEIIEQIAVDGQGNIFVLDGRKFAIFKLSPDGKLLTRFAGRSENPGDRSPKGMFSGRPMDLALDSQGRLFVSEVSRVSIFDSNGNYLNDFKATQAFGLAITSDDRVFIASRPNVVAYKLSL